MRIIRKRSPWKLVLIISGSIILLVGVVLFVVFAVIPAVRMMTIKNNSEIKPKNISAEYHTNDEFCYMELEDYFSEKKQTLVVKNFDDINGYYYLYNYLDKKITDFSGEYNSSESPEDFKKRIVKECAAKYNYDIDIVDQWKFELFVVTNKLSIHFSKLIVDEKTTTFKGLCNGIPFDIRGTYELNKSAITISYQSSLDLLSNFIFENLSNGYCLITYDIDSKLISKRIVFGPISFIS